MKLSTDAFFHKAERPRGAVLLLHGMTANPSELRHLGDYLFENGFSVHCPCLSGHCQSIEELSQISSSVWIEDAVRGAENVIEECTNIPFFVIGLSFGSLLASIAAARASVKPSGLVLMSAPMKFNSRKRSFFLPLLSRFPDWFLNLLWCEEKQERDKSSFKLPRHAYDHHSVGAAARLVQVRRIARVYLRTMELPLLAMQDPEDHHLNPKAVEEVVRVYRGNDVQFELFPGGEHELTLGPLYEDVEQRVLVFLNKRLGKN